VAQVAHFSNIFSLSVSLFWNLGKERATSGGNVEILRHLRHSKQLEMLLFNMNSSALTTYPMEQYQ
jgi:hypothetical protein